MWAFLLTFVQIKFQQLQQNWIVDAWRRKNRRKLIDKISITCRKNLRILLIRLRWCFDVNRIMQFRRRLQKMRILLMTKTFWHNSKHKIKVEQMFSNWNESFLIFYSFIASRNLSATSIDSRCTFFLLLPKNYKQKHRSLNKSL